MITKDQVQKLMASGQSEKQAIDSAKRIESETLKNPKLMLQPRVMKDGKMVDNPAFKREYGDYKKIWAETHKNVGRSDYEQKQAMDKEIADRKKSRLKIKYTI
jgi:hypothetical protein